MIADLERKIKYIIDNVKQIHSGLMENTIEINLQNKNFHY